jgi:HD-GYP domain-containing protein (c-di-GMP phosphodiesterase class II)
VSRLDSEAPTEARKSTGETGTHLAFLSSMHEPIGERPFTLRPSRYRAAASRERRAAATEAAKHPDQGGAEASGTGSEPGSPAGDAGRGAAAPPGWLGATLWRRSAETVAHQARIARIAERLARELGWPDDQCQALELAASVHDIGKLALPRRVLHKPGPLGPVERKIVQSHTLLGPLLLYGRPGAWIQLARSIALHHHERWDGGGYPRGLAGGGIPAAARIVAVADVFDALTHPRTYRPAFPVRQVVSFMRTQRARHFDPEVIDCFLDLIPSPSPPEAIIVCA